MQNKAIRQVRASSTRETSPAGTRCLFLYCQPSVFLSATRGGPRAEPTPPLPPGRPTGRELSGGPGLRCVLRHTIGRWEAIYSDAIHVPGHSRPPA